VARRIRRSGRKEEVRFFSIEPVGIRDFPSGDQAKSGDGGQKKGELVSRFISPPKPRCRDRRKAFSNRNLTLIDSTLRNDTEGHEATRSAPPSNLGGAFFCRLCQR
jgi:hypothetical protein